MGQKLPGNAPTGKRDRDFIEWLVREMKANHVFHCKLDGIELQMSQYAFAPKAAVAPAFTPKPSRPEPTPADAPEFEAQRAFKPWKAKKVELVPKEKGEPAPPLDPTDPQAEIDDDALFGADLPSGH